jgi:hypothetical protein
VPLAIPPGFAQCSIEIRNSGDPDPWYVTHGVDVSEAGGDYTAVGETVMSAFAAGWLTFLRTTSRVTGVFLTIGSDGGNYTLFVTPPTAIVGTSVVEKLPQNCAYLIQKVTERPGRSGKGRCFLPGIAPEGAVDDVGVISSGSITSGQSAANAWLAYLAGSGPGPTTPMVLLHNEGVPGGTVPSPVTALRLAPVIATQRRRLRR